MRKRLSIDLRTSGPSIHASACSLGYLARTWLWVAVVAIQAIAFLLFYRRVLGGVTSAFAPHLVLIGLAVTAASALARPVAEMKSGIPRKAALFAFGVAASALTVFYLSASVCLFGFRDLPTRQIVLGYLTQLPALISTIPFHPFMLLMLTAAVIGGIVSIASLTVWSIAGLSQRAPSKTLRRKFLGVAQLASEVLVVGVIISPCSWYLENLEPLTRSIHDQPLAQSRLESQVNAIDAARENRIQSNYLSALAGSRQNVILIYVDALRADVLQSYGSSTKNMPFVTGLVASGALTQFPRVYATCSMTLCGLGSILQSRPAHRVNPDNFSLPNLLKRQGYETRYLLSGDHQSFLSLKRYYGTSIDYYRDGKDIDASRSTDDKIIFGELEKLSHASKNEKPQFLMIGLMSAHIWGKKHEEFRHFLPDKLATTSFANLGRNSTECYRNNYNNGVLQADWIIEQIWTALAEKGYLNSSIIIITSDHGESLGEHGILGHAQSLNAQELQIPLWIHSPKKSIDVREFVTQPDIAPTVLDLLELPIPESWVGSSLLRHGVVSEWLPIYFINNSDQFGLIHYQLGRIEKYLWIRSNQQERLYDLGADPMEVTDLSEQTATETMVRFRQKLRSEFGALLVGNTSLF